MTDESKEELSKKAKKLVIANLDELNFDDGKYVYDLLVNHLKRLKEKMPAGPSRFNFRL